MPRPPRPSAPLPESETPENVLSTIVLLLLVHVSLLLLLLLYMYNYVYSPVPSGPFDVDNSIFKPYSVLESYI